jgi:16S rRNA (adenine1518-N6/adenine1519-N6)-dimethyltransferase
MKLSDMRRLLEAGDIRLTKSLGQNFLHDGNQLRRMVGAAELTRADKVLEVGPGLGPLTERLVAEAGEVLAIEKDSRLVEFLRQRFGDALEPIAAPGRKPVLRLIHADALKFLRDAPHDWRNWKVVANLPYSVASPILVELAQAARPPERMVVTVQLEVAQRLTAGADAKDYGILTLLIQLRYTAHGGFKIPASCFFPAPKVDSACVKLLRRSEPLLDPAGAATFTRIVKRSFSQRRKMMLKLLKEDWPAEALRSGFAEAGLSDSTRAESVRLDQFVTLTRCLAPGGDAQA